MTDTAKSSAPQSKRYRLTARAQMGGQVQEPGYEFVLPAGEKGPHRTERALDSGRPKDVPLYEEIVDKPVEVAHGASVADDLPPVRTTPPATPMHGASIADAGFPRATAPSPGKTG